MRKPLDFIIVTTPHDDYQSIAKIFDSLGIKCTIESSITDWWSLVDVEDEGLIQGDCSWFAAPYLDHLSDTTIILHQTINPLHYIPLMMESKLFEEWDTDYTNSYYKDYSANKFVKFQGKTWNWPASTIERIELFYSKWNKTIEEKSQNKKYMRYKIEDMGTDLIEQLLWFIGKPNVSSFSEINPSRLTAKRKSNLRFENLQQETKELYIKYDYLL